MCKANKKHKCLHLDLSPISRISYYGYMQIVQSFKKDLKNTPTPKQF